MTEESEETVERLVCQYGHMAKPGSDYEEGDECPNYLWCSCRDHKFKKVEISKERIELKRKSSRIALVEPDEDGLEYTPHEFTEQMIVHYEDRFSPFRVRFDEREHMAEAFKAFRKLAGFPYNGVRKELVEFVENPWSFCLECGKVCKNSKGRKIHETKEHWNNVFL